MQPPPGRRALLAPEPFRLRTGASAERWPARQSEASRRAGWVALALLLALALLAPLALPAPGQVDVAHGLAVDGAPLPPSLASPLGTDDLGRDVAARICEGLRLSLATAGLATVLALTLGAGLGLATALARDRAPWLHAALTRLVEVLLALPTVLLAMLAAAAVRSASAGEPPPTTAGAVLVVATLLGVAGMPIAVRVTAARAHALLRSEMVLAAHALGASSARLLLRHVLPNLRPLLVVVAFFLFSQLLLAEAALSFLGLGPPPPAATLGRMVMDGRPFYRLAPWLMWAPGLAIVLAVTTFHLLAASRRERARGDA